MVRASRTYRDVPRNIARRVTYRRRPAIEALEDRRTPSISLNFIPIAVVAVNPQPLPPSEIVDFDPLLAPPSPAESGTTSGPIVIVGQLTQTGQVGESTATSAPTTWSLDVFYSLFGQVTESVTPSVLAAGATPTAGAQFSVSASYTADGQMVSVLTVHTPSGTQQTVAVDNVALQGSLTGTDTRDPFSGGSLGRRKWESFTLVEGVVSSPSFSAWMQQVRDDSSGSASQTVQPAPGASSGVSVSASFSQNDAITGCLMPLTPPGHPPEPCDQIDATFAAAGTLTANLHPPDPAIPVSLVDGTVQYVGDLSEFITLPPTATSAGDTLTVTRHSTNKGSFVAIHLES